jgi:trehalose 6-phosphate phosphatase
MAHHLFDCWAQVSARVRVARTVRLFLDFDGTLATIRATPDAVTLSAGTRQALVRLVRHGRVRAAIVSGRRRADLVEHVGLPRVDHIEYWGLYGWEHRDGRALSADARRAVGQARDRIAPRLADLQGVRLEDKAFGFSIHFRGATPTAARRARARLTRELARTSGDPGVLHMVAGDKTWNVLPREVGGKGAAIREALGRDRASCLPIYVGDDATDEPAFAALGDGISVRVGAARGTQARFWVRNPRQVRRLIERLDRELSW